MKRSILVSLMIIGAVAALISGATFSAFTDTETIEGTITAGNVDVDLDGATSLAFTPAPCPSPIGSETVCTTIITVNYTGSLAATLDMSLAFTPSDASCFAVSLAWDGSGIDPAPATGGTGTLSLLDQLAENGTVTVTVQIDSANLLLTSQAALDACQDATTNIMTLTVVATETI